MQKIIEIAQAEGWDTLPHDSPEHRVFALAATTPVVKEEKPEPKKAKKTTKKKGKK